jgi:virginiamycin B lyase
MRAPAFALTLAALMVVPAPQVAAQTATDPELTEWMVPYEQSRPRDPMVAPDGRVWFVGQRSDYVAYFDPESDAFTRIDLEDGAGPHNAVVAEDGTVFYTGNRANHIGEIDPATGAITKHMMPDESARDPHTMIFDSQGDIWFTVQQGNLIGKLWRESGEVRLVSSAVPGFSGSRPYGIVVDSQDRPWIALFNTNHLGTVDPATFQLRTYELPENARPRRIGITSDDVLWYGDWVRGTLGRVDPETGEVREFPLPSGERARPYAVAVDDQDRVWVVETGVQPNQFVGFDPRTEEIFSVTPVESGGGTVRHMYFDEETNSIWFGADTNTIGVAKLPPRRAVSD